MALWVTNVVVGLLVIADMLYGRHMCKKMMGGYDYSFDTKEEINMDFIELEERDEEIEKRVSALEEQARKPKRTSRKKTTRK